jgi:hypothetical protein
MWGTLDYLLHVHASCVLPVISNPCLAQRISLVMCYNRAILNLNISASRLSNMVEHFRFLELGYLILSTLVFQAFTGIDVESNKTGQSGKNILFHPCVTCATIIWQTTVLVVLNLIQVTECL